MQLIAILILALLVVAEFIVILVLWKKSVSVSGKGTPDLDSALLRAGRKVVAGSTIPAAVHEFRQPLTVASGYVDLLKAKLWNNEDIGDYLDTSQKSLAHLSESITELRDLARPSAETGGITKLKLSDLLREVTDFLHEQFENHKIQIETSFPNDEPEIEIRKSECKLMFLCLFDNARNALDAISDSRKINVSIEMTSANVRVTIADNGPGMDSVTLHHCFEPFYSTSPNGSGLGLPFSGAVMRHHGGGIRVELRKSPASGCVVIVAFPKKGLPYVQ